MRKTLGLAATLVIALSCGPIRAQPAPPAAGEHITRAQIERMFAELEVRPGFFPKGNLRWSYYFLGTDRAKLEKAAEQLMAQGYTLVGIEPVQRGIRTSPTRGSFMSSAWSTIPRTPCWRAMRSSTRLPPNKGWSATTVSRRRPASS